MRRVHVLTVALTKNWLRSRSGIFFSILFPILLLLIFGSVFGGQQVKYTLFVQNLDVDSDGNPSELSQAFIEALNSTGILDLERIPGDVEPMKYAREKVGKIGSPRALVVPRGFQEDAINGSIGARIHTILDTLRMWVEQFGEYIPEERRGEIDRGMKGLEEFNQTLPVRKGTLILMLQAGDQGAAAIRGVVMDIVNRFNAKLVAAGESIELREEVEEARGWRAADYYVPGYIAAFTLTNGVIGLSSVVSDFRRRGVVKRFSTTPLTKAEWVVSNVLQQSILALILTIIMIAVGWMVFSVRVDLNPLSLALIFLGALMSSGMGMLVGGAVKDPEAASAAGNSIAFPLMFLSGSFWPLEIMPEFMQRLAQFLPLTYLSRGLRNSMIYGDLTSALLDAATVAGLACIFMALGVLATRWRER